MIAMLLKMSALTALYILLTMLLWLRLKDRPMTAARRIAVGVVFGVASVLSTHFGVDYGDMMLNVRDIGPLAAGLFFDPLSGIIAGLIGAVERYIAGTYWQVGAYTTLACSVSTGLAGFLAAFLNRFIFKGRKPSATYAFFMGAVMEVFHMYAVLVTHRSDMNMAYYVVQTCAGPMIVFTGLGLAVASAAMRGMSGEWRNPLRRKREDVSVSQRFEFWLFAVTMVILLGNYSFSYAIQTQTAVQNAHVTLNEDAADIRETYERIMRTKDGIEELSRLMGLMDAGTVASAVGRAGGVEAVDAALLEDQRAMLGLDSACILTREGEVVLSAGEPFVYRGVLNRLVEEDEHFLSDRLSGDRVVADVAFGDHVIQAVLETEYISDLLNQSGLDDAMSYFHVGNNGTFDIVSSLGYSLAGEHRAKVMPQWSQAREQCEQGVAFFTDAPYGVQSICRAETLDDGSLLLLTLPVSEMFQYRDTQALETALADILLFTVIYVLISLLVQRIVVNNLYLVNNSLSKITGGDLNEVVNVRNSSEFASLSDDINQTVTVLKGYIAAAEKRIEQELEFARSIQDAALPKNFDFPNKAFELYATMDPAKEVGGDFYDFFFVDNDHLALVIADVSGKGIPAALFMMRSKTAIRSLAETGGAPAEILYKANNTLCEGNDAEMFVTAWIGIIDLRTGVMRCANAGHEYPSLMRAGGEYELFLDKHGLALAAMEDMPFREYELVLKPGDKLFVYTDGIPEAIDEDTEQYGTERMLARLNALKDASMRDTLPAVRQDIADFAGGAEQFDDITMLGLTYFGYEKERGES